MRNWFYFLVYFLGYPPMVLASATTVLHRDRVPRKGPFILASNHLSPFDTACLIKETPRVLHYLSLTTLFKHPMAGWFLRNMKCVPLDRSKHDTHSLRQVLQTLEEGRAVALFPEANIRNEQTSVLNGGRLKPGVGRIAKMSGAPIIPCVVIGTPGFQRLKNWLPLRRIKIGLAYGEPIRIADDSEAEYAAFEDRLRACYIALYEELKQAMNVQSFVHTT